MRFLGAKQPISAQKMKASPPLSIYEKLHVTTRTEEVNKYFSR